MDKKIIKNLIKFLIGLAVIAAIWYLVKCHCINFKAITPAALRDYIQGFGASAPVIYILAYALNTVSILPPIAALSLSAGLAFGSFWGAIYLMLGALLGTSVTFMISRFFARGLAVKIMQGKFKSLDEKLASRGFFTVLFFRVIPIIPYEVLNYASGISRIKFKDYFLATLLGLVPGVVIAAFFGGSLGEVNSIKDLLTPKFGLAILLMVLIIAVPLVYEKIKKKKER